MPSIVHKVRRSARGRNRAADRRSPSFARAGLVAVLAVLAACAGDAAVGPAGPAPVASVAVTPGDVTLLAGTALGLGAVVRGDDGGVLADRAVTWTVAPAAVATIDAGGIVRAVAPGVATVTATAGGRQGTARVVVAAPGDGPMPPGDTVPAFARPALASISPARIPDAWPDALTLTVHGARFAPGAVVTFGGVPLETHRESATLLRARIAPAELVAMRTVEVRVVNPPLAAELDSDPLPFSVVPRLPATVRVASPLGHPWTWVGERLPLAADALTLAGQVLPGRVPAWGSDRADVARVDADGRVLGAAPGSATIAATVDGVTGRLPVRVLAAPSLGLVWTTGAGPARRLALWFPGRGEQPTQIATGITAYDPAPSPDGRRIAFTGVSANGEVDVYVLTRAGGAVRRLTSADGPDDMPAWSPDGARIAFRSTRAGRSDVWVMDADGGDPRRLTDQPDATAGVGGGEPAWSPDGAWLAYVWGAAADRDVWLMRADGTGRRRLAADASDDREPAWSADGASIAYRRGSGAEARLEVRRVADGAPVPMPTPLGAGASPAYAPTGGWLAFARPTAAGWALHVAAGGSGAEVRAVLAPTLDAGAQVAWLRP